MFEINACGLSCPEPVILLKKAIKNNHTEITLLVDNKTSVETCTRYGESNGFTVSVTTENKIHKLLIKKDGI